MIQRLEVKLIDVLIDTWWNVNKAWLGQQFIDDAGFNRYMVECEYDNPNIARYEGQCFNRYMVECE